MQLTSSSSFDLESIRHEKTVHSGPTRRILWVLDECIFRSVFNVCMRRMLTKSTLPCYILFDEFGHSMIPSFVSVANTIRGYKVSLSIVLQSLSQLSARYGRDYALSIQGRFNTYLAYSGSDQETAKFFEAIAGKVIEVRKDKIEDVTQQRHEYNLLNADAIRRIQDHEALLVSANKNPAIISTVGYFQNRALAKIPKRYGAAYLSKSNTSATVKRVPLQ